MPDAPENRPQFDRLVLFQAFVDGLRASEVKSKLTPGVAAFVNQRVRGMLSPDIHIVDLMLPLAWKDPHPANPIERRAVNEIDRDFKLGYTKLLRNFLRLDYDSLGLVWNASDNEILTRGRYGNAVAIGTTGLRFFRTTYAPQTTLIEA